jgi:hypothetical protein
MEKANTRQIKGITPPKAAKPQYPNHTEPSRGNQSPVLSNPWLLDKDWWSSNFFLVCNQVCLALRYFSSPNYAILRKVLILSIVSPLEEASES